MMICSLLLSSGAATLLAVCAASAHPPYELVDLGDFAGGAASAGAITLNGSGHVVGGADDKVGRQAYIYVNGKLRRLPTPAAPHAVFSEAIGVNNAGVVAGNTYTDSIRSRAAIWDKDGYHDLGTLGGLESGVIDMNAFGAVIGHSDLPSSFASFIWLPSPAYGFPAGMSAIDTFVTRSINDAGQIAAQVQPPNGRYVAAIWLPEGAYGLPAGLNPLVTPLFEAGAVPHGMNNRGAIVGGGLPDEFSQHPALWLPESMYGLDAGWHDIGLVGPDRVAFAWDINDRGWVVGTRTWFGEPPSEFEDPPVFIEGWLWIPGLGRINLNELLPAESEYSIVYPRGINNRGQIAASAVSSTLGTYRAVLLSPTCAPDWNADGRLNSGDFFDFVTDFFEGYADFNADSATTSQDFFDFLTAFFTGC
jgi:hypothetical protein